MLSRQGTQHRAASGEEGVVYAWGTRCVRVNQGRYSNASGSPYMRISIRWDDELYSIEGFMHAVLDFDRNWREFASIRDC
jgi:hypothetical protein